MITPQIEMGCLQSREVSALPEREEERKSLIEEENRENYDSEESGEAGAGETGRTAPESSYLSRAGESREEIDEPPVFQPSFPRESPGKQRELNDFVSADMGQSYEASSDSALTTKRGREIMAELQKAYRWREKFSHPTQEFLALMDRLYMECQVHLTALASREDAESTREADAIVNEMVALRNYWGPQLLPSSTCNAFVRERIPLTLGVEQWQFRIDCAQFFEPVPFYGSQQSSTPGELMKLYRFSVYNVSRNEVVLRYYLERSNVTQFYHVLCFMDDSCHGQVKPYGTEAPSYWEVRRSMLEDLGLRLAPESQSPPPPPLALTVFASGQVGH